MTIAVMGLAVAVKHLVVTQPVYRAYLIVMVPQGHDGPE